jgi:hypothetical protein
MSDEFQQVIDGLIACYGENHTEPDCKDLECSVCGERDCPYHDPFHYHHDGCPACTIYRKRP